MLKNFIAKFSFCCCAGFIETITVLTVSCEYLSYQKIDCEVGSCNLSHDLLSSKDEC